MIILKYVGEITIKTHAIHVGREDIELYIVGVAMESYQNSER